MYVLGRLTYSAYLFHTFIQRVKIGMKRTPNYMNDYLMVTLLYFFNQNQLIS
jgi:hypothetical protein